VNEKMMEKMKYKRKSNKKTDNRQKVNEKMMEKKYTHPWFPRVDLSPRSPECYSYKKRD
jgi:hypothetical protein